MIYLDDFLFVIAAFYCLLTPFTITIHPHRNHSSWTLSFTSITIRFVVYVFCLLLFFFIFKTSYISCISSCRNTIKFTKKMLSWFIQSYVFQRRSINKKSYLESLALNFILLYCFNAWKLNKSKLSLCWCLPGFALFCDLIDYLRDLLKCLLLSEQ